jgi:type VI protein secretion system component VasK
MRRLLAFLARPIVWSTGGLLLLLLALHVVCPLLGVEEDKRWIIELLVGAPLAVLLVGYWVRQLLVERRLASDMASQAKKHALAQGPDALRDYKAFSEEFTRAFAQLSSQCRERGLVGGAAALPWVMILGPSGVGKSTALERSGLRFTSLGRRLQGIGGTRNCTWWLASDAVFLDTAGRYAVRDEDRDEWRTFLHLLRKRRRRPIDAVLLQVGIDELLDRPRAEVERAALQLRERLDELASLLDAQVPVHLLFNKCDLLDGFVEFFGGIDKQEQAQPWGFQLDTSALTAELLGAAFSQRFANLVRTLTERSTTRLLALPEREPREAALGFPAELAALGATLSFFTETLFEPRARGERPWLCAVYLGSAEQTGQRAPGLRQRRAEELALSQGASSRLSTASASTGAGGETFFLRGVFTQVLRQAESAARPSTAKLSRMRLHQRVAVGLAMAACAAGSWYLGGRYSSAMLWFSRLEARAKQMDEAKDLPLQAARATKAEMVAELARQEAVRGLLVDAPSGLPPGPAATATALLRRRTEKQWLWPLKSQMQQDLEQAAKRQGTDPGKDFSHGFLMLRLLYVLRGNSCAGTDPELTRQSLAQYIVEHWQRALGEQGRWLALAGGDDEDAERPRAPSAQLRRQLELLFDQEPPALRDTVRLKFDEGLREEARQSLVSSGDQSSVVFNLRASLTNLYEPKAQLSTPLLNESGVERVFTTTGCATFFGKEASRGSEWWKCVLDIPLPKDPPNLEQIYQQKYVEAWNRWLHELALKPTPKKEAVSAKDGAAVSVVDAIQALDGLVRDARPALPQVLQTVGRGREGIANVSKLRPGKRPFYAGCGKRFGKSVDWGTEAIKDIAKQRECAGVLDLVAPMNQLAAKDKPPEDDAEAGSAREDYQKYLAAAKTLRATLNRIKESTERNSEALKLVQATMGASGDLWATDTARTEFIASLDSRLSGTGFDLAGSGLNITLRSIEGLAWRALLPLAAQALNEQWKNVVASKWKTLKESEPRLALIDEERCKGRTQFLREELGKGFIDKSLAVFYAGNNLSQCSLKKMAPPFDEQLKLTASACAQLRAARQVGDEIVDCPKAMGASGGGAKRDILRADVKPPPVKDCTWPAMEAILDRGDKTFVCQQSTGKCTSSDATSQRAQLKIRWQEHEVATIYDFDYFEQLKQHAQSDSNNGLLFRIPKNKTSMKAKGCEGYLVRFEQAPVGAGGGPIPKAADNRWKNVDLPQLLH